MSLLLEVTEMPHFDRQERASQVPEECFLLSNVRNPYIVQAELISGYLDFHL